MRFDLRSGKESTAHAVFDPDVVLEIMGELAPAGNEPGRPAAEILAGRVLLYHAGEKGPIVFRIFVGEEPPKDVFEHATDRIGNVFLTVPTGRLLAMGVNELCSAAKPDVTADELEAIADGTGGSACIPAGEYVAELFSLRSPEVALPVGGRALRAIGILGGMTAVLGTIVVVLVAAVGLILGKPWVALLGYWVLGTLGSWLAFCAARKLLCRVPANRQAVERRQALRNRFAFDAAIVLRPARQHVAASHSQQRVLVPRGARGLPPLSRSSHQRRRRAPKRWREGN